MPATLHRMRLDYVVTVVAMLCLAGGWAHNAPAQSTRPTVTAVTVQFDDGTTQRLAGAPAATTAGAPAFTVTHAGAVAPATVHVRAIVDDEPDVLLRTRYDWDFGDAGAPGNALSGPSAAHTYDSAGEYRITLRRTPPDGLPVVTAARVRIIADTRPRLYVAADGDDSALGLDPGRPLRTIAQAGARLGDGTVILLRRGDRFAIDRTLLFSRDNLLLGAYGTGENPVIAWAGARDGDMLRVNPDCDGLTIQDVAFYAPPDRSACAIRAGGTNLTVRRCAFLRVIDAINANGRPHGMLVQGCSVPSDQGLEGYFVWLEGTDVVVAGNTVPNSTRQHIVRMNQFDGVLIAENDFANIDRRPDDPSDTAKGCIVVQQGQNCWVMGNNVRGGGIGVGPLGGGDGVAQKLFGQRSRYVVVAGNLCDGRGITVGSGAQDVLVRDNRIRVTNGFGIHIMGWEAAMNRGVERVRIDRNTVYNDAGSKIADPGKRFGGGWKLWAKTDDLHITDNLFAAPGVPMRNGDGAAAVVNGNDFFPTEVANNVYDFGTGGNKYFYAWNGWADAGVLSLESWTAKGAVNERVKSVPLDDDLYPTADAGGAGARRGQ